MTPELVPQAQRADGEGHLTGEQFGELLARFTEGVGPEPTLRPRPIYRGARRAPRSWPACGRRSLCSARRATPMPNRNCAAYRAGDFRSGACSRIGLCLLTG